MKRAFTLLELLVMIIIILAIVAILLPSVAKARESARRTACGVNLRSVGQGVAVYASTWNNQIPLVGGNADDILWFWDVTLGTGDLLVDATAVATKGKPASARRLLYCPSNQVQNDNNLWEYPNQNSARIRVIGYGWLGARVGTTPLGVIPITARTNPPLQFQDRWASGTRPAVSELAFDAIISQQGRYVDIVGGSSLRHNSSHLRGAAPAGQNVLYCDGHVDWKSWLGTDMATGLEAARRGIPPTFWIINP